MKAFQRALTPAAVALALACGVATAQQAAAASAEVCALRDKALSDAGWAAGNAIDAYFWDQVLPYVGVNGIHTTELAAIDCSDPQKANSQSGFSIYRAGFQEGKGQPFDEAEVIARMQSIKADTATIKQRMAAGQ